MTTLHHWDAHAISGEPLSTLVAGLREHRARGALGDLMMDSVTLADIYEDCDQLMALDAIIVPMNTLKRKMTALQAAMKRTGSDIYPASFEVSDPFTQRGSTQIAVIFALSDGQTITVFFHNPDTTPKRIKATDELVSWKWLLNKKDVTITVAPEHGQDLKVQDVARRVMLLAKKNSTAFKRINAKKHERDAVIQSLKDEVTTLEATLASERAALEAAKAVDGLGRDDSDPAEGNQIIEQWDAVKADALLGNIEAQDDGSSSEALAREFIAKHLQGRIVKTPIGDCLISAESKGKLPRGAGRKGGLKLKAIPRIPEILVSGEVGALEENNKVRSDSKNGFYPFKKMLEIGELRALALLKIARRDGAPNLVYNLDVHAVKTLDSAHEKSPTFTRRCTGNAVVDLGLDGASELILDKVFTEVNDDINLFILEVYDKDGNRLHDLEDGDDTEPAIDAPQTEEDGLSDDPNAPNYRYADTGHIAGARKFDVTEAFREAVKNGQLMRWRDLDWEGVEENPRRAKELITKSNLFGKVDWAALREGGMEPGAAFLIDRVYASLASEPDDSPEARKNYARGIESVRERLEACKTADEVVATLHEMYEEKRGVMLDAQESEQYQAAIEEAERLHPSKHPLEIEHKKLIDVASKAQRELWSVQEELRKSRKKQNPELDAAKIKAEQAYREASDASIAFVEQNPELKSIKRDLGNGRITFENDIEHAYRNARGKARLILDLNMARNLASNPTTRAWNALGGRFDSVLNGKSEAFAGHRAAVRMGKVKDWAWAEKEGATKAPTQRAARFQLQVADSYERIGGREVKAASTAELKERFGLRNVQSGNWVLKDPESAQWHVQHAAEAMTDLADLLGVDPAKLAVGGRVALAFGARGKGNAGFGGGAAAHYEPVERVINITKMKGGGSLAHEWFHALDNLIPESMGLNAGSDNMVTEDAAVRAALPPAVSKAIEELVSAMRDGDKQGRRNMTITQEWRSNAARNAPNAYRYGADSISSRVFSAKSLDEAFEAIKAKEDAYKASKERRGSKFTAKDAKTYDDWRAVAAAHHTPADQAVASVPVGGKMSSFALEAANLDAGGSKPYWSKTLELSARAFQAYVEDRLSEKGQKNDYLSAKADNKFYVDPIFGDSKPFPEGEERERINKAFDKLFESLRGTGVLDSVFAMF